MQRFEFKVVPAPRRAKKTRGAKTGEERFAVALQELMNELGAQGWDYVRTDTLPLEERQGLTGRTTTFQNMLVFRRPLADEAEEETAEPRLALPPVAEPDAPPAPDPQAPAAEGPRQEPQPPRPFPGPEPRIVETLTRPGPERTDQRTGPRLVAERGDARRGEDGPRHPAE